MGRPLGEIALALLKAAEAGPGTVKELAARAQVGYAAARFTCSRLCAMGKLQAVDTRQATGRGRDPQVLVPAGPQAPPAPGGDLAAVLSGWGAPAVQRRSAKKRPADERDLLAEILAETRGTPANRKQ